MGEKHQMEIFRYFPTYYKCYTMPLILLSTLFTALHAAQILTVGALDSLSPNVNNYRLMVVRNNLQLIEEHNRDPTQTYKLKPYKQFIGLTQEQVNAKYFRDVGREDLTAAKPDAIDLLPLSIQGNSVLIDLRKYINTTVKYQGWKCANSYAFATADLIDMLYYSSRITLSSQQIADCSSATSTTASQRNSGCYSGRIDNSLAYVQSNGLYLSENVYPVDPDAVNNGQNHSCISIAKNSYATRTFKIRNWTMLTPNNPNQRATLLATRRPIASHIAAGNYNFYYYGGGVLPGCNDTKLTHSVILMGFSFNTSWGDYWLVKNSWGESWGERGYIRIQMGESCGLLQEGYIVNV